MTKPCCTTRSIHLSARKINAIDSSAVEASKTLTHMYNVQLSFVTSHLCLKPFGDKRLNLTKLRFTIFHPYFKMTKIL